MNTYIYAYISYNRTKYTVYNVEKVALRVHSSIDHGVYMCRHLIDLGICGTMLPDDRQLMQSEGIQIE